MATPTIIHGLVTQPIVVPASLTLQESIVVPAGEMPITTARFTYRNGDPPANAFKLQFFLSEADALADRNPLEGVDAYLSYGVFPATPLPLRDATSNIEQDGYIRLERIGVIPYETICIKFSICQDGNIVTELSRTPIVMTTLMQRQRVYSNWKRR